MAIPVITDGELGSDIRTLSLNPVIVVVNTLGTASTKNVGTAANDVVQLTASAKLPSVDASDLLMSTVPTSDPHVAGALYTLAGALMVSAG